MDPGMGAGVAALPLVGKSAIEIRCGGRVCGGRAGARPQRTQIVSPGRRWLAPEERAPRGVRTRRDLGPSAVARGWRWRPLNRSLTTLTAPCALVYRQLIWCHTLFAQRAASARRPPGTQVARTATQWAPATATLAWTTKHGIASP